MNWLKPARGTNEPFLMYKSRRRVMNRTLKQILRGTMRHLSTAPVQLDMPGVNPEHDKLVKEGQVVRVQFATIRTGKDAGKACRIALTKGDTYRRPVPKAPSRRDLWRSGVR